MSDKLATCCTCTCICICICIYIRTCTTGAEHPDKESKARSNKDSSICPEQEHHHYQANFGESLLMYHV